MIELLWFACGVVASELGTRAIKAWHRSDERRRMDAAAETLKQNGMAPNLYLATIGTTDSDLRRALNAFASKGHIITNARGQMVGAICRPDAKECHLRLVVSSD